MSDPKQGPGTAERRHVTVLFVDMVGSTAFATRLDPEDYRDLIRVYQSSCKEQIQRFGGLVTRYVGDGIQALFGYPSSHEDDPERALNAALAIVASIPSLEIGKALGVREGVKVRCGIATGLVVVGDRIGEAPAMQEEVIGDAPPLASRLQELAGENGVVTHDLTRRLAGDRFEYDDLGHRALKGFDEPVHAWKVLHRRADRSRFEAAHPSHLSPLVGREQALATLCGRWNAAARGEGQTVIVAGESGIGKSRIAQSLDEAIADVEHATLRLQCSSYHAATPLHPFIEQLEWNAGLAPSDRPAEKMHKIELHLRELGLETGVARPLLASLLSIPDPSQASPGTTSAQRQRLVVIDLFVERLCALASRQPLLLLFEDLQWADPTSLELLELLVERIRSEAILLLVTHRPELDLAWSRRPRVTTLQLPRLSAHQARQLVDHVARSRSLSRDLVEQIVAKSDGIPLFLEEVTRAVQADGGDSKHGSFRTVPPTVHDTLVARLDQVSEAKPVAQLGSVLGRSFPFALIAAVAEVPTERLQDDLERLVRAGLLYRETLAQQVAYTFKHALLRDAAYDSLLRRERRRLHARVAGALASASIDGSEPNPSVVAMHHFEAGQFRQSAECWLSAGRAAIERSANIEALSHLRNALEALGRSENPADLAELELGIQLSLGVSLTTSEGFASAGVQRAFERAHELCSRVPESPQLFYALCGLGSFYTVRANLTAAREIGQRMLGVGTRSASTDLVLWGRVAIGVTQLNLGEFSSARENLHEGLAVYDPSQHAHHAFVFGQDAGVIGRCHLAWAEHFIGEPEAAEGAMTSALDLAEGLGHSFSLAYARTFAAWLSCFRCDASACAGFATGAMALAVDQGFPLLLAMAKVVQGWATAAEGDLDAGLRTLREGLAEYEMTGAELGRPAMLGLQALVTARCGQTAAALRIARSALTLAREHGEHVYEPQLRELIGHLGADPAGEPPPYR